MSSSVVSTAALAARLPRGATQVIETLTRAGYEAWCVGGAVRDALLERDPKDWDVATNATPDTVLRLFRRTIPTGLAHGTVTVMADDREGYEVTTFRRDVSTDGRHATVAFADTIEEDLARRDFTCNAIAWAPHLDTLVDPFGGRDALTRGELHTVGQPDDRFAEDRLRVLRALRFAGRFGWRIGDQTWDAMQQSAPHLHPVSVERILQEWKKSLEQIRHPSHTFRLWDRAGIFAHRLPDLQRVPLDAWRALDALGGAPETPMPHGWRAELRFHLPFATLGAGRARAVLEDLRASSHDLKRTMALATALEQWGPSLTQWLAESDRAPRASVTADQRRFLAAVGRDTVKPVLRAHALLTTPTDRAPAPVAPPLHRRLVQEARRVPLTLADLAVTGRDLMAAGWPRGPQLGQTLQALLDAVLEDPTRNTTAQLLALAGPPPARLAKPERGGATR